ncbi:MAG: ATP-binding protein [Magnetospirillum sp.]
MSAGTVILFEGGRIPDSLAYRAAKLGVEACPNVEFLDFPATRVMMAPMSMVAMGLRNGFSGFIEYRPSDQMCPLNADLVQAVENGGLCLSASTESLLYNDPAHKFCEAVLARFPKLDVMRVELAVAEACGNAVIHGNLGLASDLRHSLAGLAEFNDRIAARVADPTMAARRVRLTAWPMGESVEIRVSDDGDGYDLDAELAKPVDVVAKSGRGLGLIRKVSAAVRGLDGGRTLCMRFDPTD